MIFWGKIYFRRGGWGEKDIPQQICIREKTLVGEIHILIAYHPYHMSPLTANSFLVSNTTKAFGED